MKMPRNPGPKTKSDIQLFKLISKESRWYTMDDFMQDEYPMGVSNQETRFVGGP